MNNKSSFGVPFKSPLFRGISRVRYLGVWAIPRLVVYRLLSVLFHYRTIRCVWFDLERGPQISHKKSTYEIRPLSQEEIKREVKLTGENTLDVDQSIEAGLEAIGAVKGKLIVSCIWISPIPPALNEDFALKFDERLTFFYRAFTLPEFRGLGLMPAVLRVALESYSSPGYRGAVACIDIANRPSWKAFRSAGFQTIATFRVAKMFGRHWIRPSHSQITPRFCVQPLFTRKEGLPRS